MTSSLFRPALAAAALVAALVGVAPADATGCTPATSSLTPRALSWLVYENPNTHAIAYKWLGSGLAIVSDDCASRLNVTVQITDHAELGNPQDVAGDVGHGYDPSASGGLFNAAADAEDFVVYYDPLGLNVRGTSVVEVKVTGSYVDTATQATVSLGCKATYTSVTPLPTGPEMTTGPVQDCE